MTAPKHAKKVDLNQQEVVDALRAIGCMVEVIGQPVDLLCGYRGKNFLIEVKQRAMEYRKDQQEQRDWMDDWKGQVTVVFDGLDAIRVVTEDLL